MIYFLGEQTTHPNFSIQFIVYILIYSLILNLVNCYFLNINFFTRHNFKSLLILILFILTYKTLIYLFFIPFTSFILNIKKDEILFAPDPNQQILFAPDPNQQIFLNENAPFNALCNTMIDSVFHCKTYITSHRRDDDIILKYRQIPSLKFTSGLIEKGLERGYSREEIYVTMYGYLASIRGQKRGYLLNYTSAVFCLSYLYKYQNKSMLARLMLREDVEKMEFALKLFGKDNFKLDERNVTINQMIIIFTAGRDRYKSWHNNYSNVSESNALLLKELHPSEYFRRIKGGYETIRVNSSATMSKTELNDGYYYKFRRDFNHVKTNAYK